MCNDTQCVTPCADCTCDSSQVFPPSVQESVSRTVTEYANAELVPFSEGVEQSPITDLSQPANRWLECVLGQFQEHLDAKEDPTFRIQIDDITFELRLVEVPGVYKRKNYVVGEDEEG